MQLVWFVSIRECREVISSSTSRRRRLSLDRESLLSRCACVDRPNVKWFDAEVVVEVWTGLSAAKWLGPLWRVKWTVGGMDELVSGSGGLSVSGEEVGPLLMCGCLRVKWTISERSWSSIEKSSV